MEILRVPAGDLIARRMKRRLNLLVTKKKINVTAFDGGVAQW
jgi:hypothetical protein